jgi:predicted dinucleotide-binding enzyme
MTKSQRSTESKTRRLSLNIGVVGSGNIGSNAAKLFANAGHELVEEIGPQVRAATVEEAADFGEVVLVAMPFFAYETLPADQLSGKVVVDAMNYYAGRDGEVEFNGLSSSEAVARHLPGSHVVKAFNTMYYETLRSEGRPSAPVEERLVLFVAGDDEEAKSIVSRLIEEIGFTPVDTGSLSEGRKQEPGSPIYNVPMHQQQARATLASIG